MQTSRMIDPPPLPAGTPGRPDRPRYRRQWGLIVVFEDEAAQRSAFDTLSKGGFKPRVVVT